MHSIRKRLSIILVCCTFIAILLSAFFVNLAVYRTFNKYLADNQDKRDERIVSYFEEIYKNDKKWTQDSGKEMQHEGYMSNYCLTLLDENKKEIWGMDPGELKNMSLLGTKTSNNGDFKTSTFPIKYENRVVGYISIGQYQPILLSEQDINFKDSINKNIAVSIILATLVSIFVSILFSRQFSEPIKQVSEASVELSQGNYESKSELKSNVLELNKLIKSIDILREQLKYQDELRKRLVSDISHEIRTPLNVLQNNLEAMIDGVFPPTTDRLNNLNDEVIRFGKLLNNLNTLKAFEEEKVAVNFEKVFLDELLYNVYEDFKVHAKGKNIDVAFDIVHEDNYSILADADKLKQVFINILSNAVKFSKDKGKISIGLSSDKEHIFVKIEDDGIGIKKEDLPFIFERMYRSDKSRHKTQGSGIGLTIVKKIMELHSATIDVESEEGVGTCFILRFNKSI